MEFKLDTSTFVAIGVIVLALFLRGSDAGKVSIPDWHNIVPHVGPVTPDVVIPEPSADAKSVVEKHDIARLLKAGKNPSVNGPQLGYFYNEFAKLTVANEEAVKSTAQIREANAKCGKILFEGNIVAGKDYPGLREAIEASVVETIGKQNAPLTPETRAKAVKIFEAIGWACYQGGK